MSEGRVNKTELKINRNMQSETEKETRVKKSSTYVFVIHGRRCNLHGIGVEKNEKRKEQKSI